VKSIVFLIAINADVTFITSALLPHVKIIMKLISIELGC